MKIPTLNSKRASFLHDDDCDPINTENNIYASAPASVDANVSASAHITSSASSQSFSSKSDSSSSSSSSSHSSSHSDYSSSESDISGLGLGLARRASRTTITASKEETAHELAAQVASRIKSRFSKNLPQALVEDYDNRDCVAPFQTTEIVIGPLLGSGEFSHVYEIKSFQPDVSLEENLSHEEVETRRHMKRRERYHDTKKACYAVKHLRPTLLDTYSKLEYAQSASDLANEAEFLASLQHPNIIKLRGISFLGAGGFANGPKGYFLIIDRLNETLEMRIKRWKNNKRRRNRLASSFKTKIENKKLLLAHAGGGRKDSKELVEGNNKEHHDKCRLLIGEEQVDVGLQISSALMYLHEKSIMFRDLKPQNIGFDVRGDVKLFDFGLATVMPIFGDPYENIFDMSGAGSPRYMAPEVLIDPPKKYNLKADVYGFGVVLWQIFSLEVPFAHIKRRDELVEFVINQEGRPTINENWPEPIKEVLHLSFDTDIGQRPSIQLFYNMLRFQLLNMRDGDDTKLGDAFIRRRRSNGSMKNLKVNDDEDVDVDRQNQSNEKFPQRMKNTIMSHVKSPPSSSNADDHHAPPRRRRAANKLRDKFRLSIKQEEKNVVSKGHHSSF